MNSTLRILYRLSLSLWFVGLYLFLNTIVSFDYNILVSGLQSLTYFFVLISIILIAYEIIICFKPINEKYDLSILTNKVKPLRHNFYSKNTTQKLVNVFKAFANSSIYIGLILVIFFPNEEYLPYYFSGLLIKSLYLAFISFEPHTEPQDLGEIFPELKQ